MRSILVAVLAAAIAGCASTATDEQKPAGVEDRTPVAGAPGTGAPGAAAKPIAQKPIAGVDLTAPAKPAAGMSPLKDPASVLSKRSIYFDFDKAEIRDEFKPLIEAHAKYLRENSSAKMLIQGNTDERGSREYNVALGQRRAEAVRRMLMLLGARDDQVEAVSLGEEKPRAQGSTEEAYAENRRSDMLYRGEF